MSTIKDLRTAAKSRDRKGEAPTLASFRSDADALRAPLTRQMYRYWTLGWSYRWACRLRAAGRPEW